jgi:hypothetical protein
MSGTNGQIAIPGESIQNLRINQDNFRKMVFIHNAVETGWTVVKKTDRYIFSKKHEGRKEIFEDDFLARFVANNLDLGTLK